MAHPATEAAEAPAPLSVDEKAAEMEKFLFPDDEEQPEPDSEEDDAPEEGEDLELEEEQDDESDEPETAIDPPVSLNAEEKAVFAQLPKEAQEAWAASETRRNAQVQEATTKASDAQRKADDRAAQADAEAKGRYAAQLQELGKALAPAEPNPAHFTDRTEYAIALHQHQQAVAQHDAFMQQVEQVGAEAQAEANAAFVQQRDRELMQIPEVANPETRNSYLDKAFDGELLAALEYEPTELAKIADASDVKRLATIADWRAKAAKYDTAMSKQMQKVRAAKGKTLRPNAAPQAATRAVKAEQAWSRVREAGGNKAAREAAMAEWLEASGHL